MHHFTAHELADAWELRAGLTDASAWDRAATVAACLRECAAELRSAATPQPEAQPPGFALVQIAELTKWKSLANSLAVLSLKSERATTAIILKSLIQDEIDAAPSAQAEQDASGFNVPVQPIGGE